MLFFGGSNFLLNPFFMVKYSMSIDVSAIKNKIISLQKELEETTDPVYRERLHKQILELFLQTLPDKK